MRMYDIIYKKRMGYALSEQEIRFFIDGYTNGAIPDYQASALCMAICIKGMDDEETAYLTDAMMRSGDLVDLSEFGDSAVDKHSTGGVGDKTTLIVAPIVAALGCKVAKMSGRGLGHTGGTVDKLESIAGYRTSLPPDIFMDNVRKHGICVIGQSGNMAPADKKIYALRDVTACIDSIPLIASSIMSKKLAAGARSIVLDVKAGSGAFMKTPEQAKVLADAMVRVGEACGRRVRALVTNMDIPLGYNIGNSLEVEEAVRVIRGEQKDDLYEICIALASAMVSLARDISEDEARVLVERTIFDGSAFEKMKEWIAAQGGDVSMIENTSLLPQAPYRYEVVSTSEGYIKSMDTEAVGIAASLLGAGRKTKDDVIDLSAGIVLKAKTGDRVNKGEPLAVLYASDEHLFAAAEEKFFSALDISQEKTEEHKLIYS